MVRKVRSVRPGKCCSRRGLRFEQLESRYLLAGDTYLVNFQLAGAPVPTRYLADTGEVFGVRASGLSYGWSSDHTDQARDRNLISEQRLDTLIHFEVGQHWEFQLPNGSYQVTVAVGDPANNDGLHTINVEGVNYWTAAQDTAGAMTMSKMVTVSDGRLTIDQGAAADKATRIDYVEIVGLPNGANAAPAPPNITEPTTDGQVVNRADVHMEAVGFSDADGNAHKSTDWEIWTVGPNAEPAWQTLGIEGVERLHTHLGDGIFVNAHAGTGFLPDTDYELRVRFRDDAGAVSDYATRLFRTGPAEVIFPLEVNDVSSAGVTWVSINGNVVLPPASPNPPQLRLESAAGELLLAIAANNGTNNAVTNPAALSDHAEVRLVVQAGSTALTLPETDLTFFDDHGGQHVIFLPAVNLSAGQRLDLWVSSIGATYYGTAAQTEPSFANLARNFDALVPYLAMQPGFVVEEVATGFRLPTNISFVPSPGPNPSDPLFYVTELYGAIKVVTRDFTVHTYAADLLNFDPTGFFPGSGEQGLTGIVVNIEDVDPTAGVDMRNVIYATRVWDTDPANGSAEPHHPQVIRFVSTADGLSAVGAPTILLNMIGETQGQSHQISNVTIGPDGKLYVHMGDGFDASTARNLNSYRGKILRMNLDGSAATDNPFYNAANGINSQDYVYAYGFRNPFGGAWRASDGKHYEVENGPSTDRFVQVLPGVDYEWDGQNSDMLLHALYNWSPAHAPVNITYVQQETFNGSQFPASMLDLAFVSESGPTLGIGPQSLGKRIVSLEQDAAGNVIGGPQTLVEYVGDGAGSVVGLSAGPDGLYFTALYNDEAKSQADVALAISAGSKIYRVRYVNPLPGDYDIDGAVDENDYSVWKSSFGSNLLTAADGNGDGIVNAADYTVWRDNLGATIDPPITLEAPGAPKSVYYDAATETYHVYQLYKTPGADTWLDAYNDADNHDYNGHAGHLATIRSSAENAAASEIMYLVINGGGLSWIGATDAPAFGAAGEGDWVWVGDDVNGGTPDSFWSGLGAGSGGAPVSGKFNNWTSNEPNNGGGTQHYADVVGPTRATGTQRAWTDQSATTGRGEYILEYDVPLADFGQEFTNGHRYEVIFGSPMTWTAARAAAQAMTPPTDYEQGDLAVINNAELQNFVMTSVLNAAGGFGPGADGGTQSHWQAWIGASDSAVEGEWRWVNGAQFWEGDASGSSVGGAYHNWAAAEPNNGVRGEDFAFLDPFQGAGQWADLAATDTRSAFIVEWKSTSGHGHHALGEDAVDSAKPPATSTPLAATREIEASATSAASIDTALTDLFPTPGTRSARFRHDRCDAFSPEIARTQDLLLLIQTAAIDERSSPPESESHGDALSSSCSDTLATHEDAFAELCLTPIP